MPEATWRNQIQVDRLAPDPFGGLEIRKSANDQQWKQGQNEREKHEFGTNAHKLFSGQCARHQLSFMGIYGANIV
ncbi:hypothetical protein [Cohnella thermotolerans]|uniref:hypothetical protein n=1 Tax=Cohnella thermotolerans TaxID=329858 RepID=UPI0012EB93C6|nr:hypothetical protein [Cohnella thermotolerans]